MVPLLLLIVLVLLGFLPQDILRRYVEKRVQSGLGAGSHIGHMHTAGNPERRDLDEEQELYYPAIMRAIAETGYDFYVGHEFTPRGDRLAALRAAFETCHVG